MPSVLVTGASRGFGRELAGEYLRRRWTVFPLVRRAEAVTEWRRHEGCHPILADVALPEVERAIGEALAMHGVLDLLVNNAGDIRKRRWLRDTVVEDIEEAFRVHCLGAFRCTRAALPFLRKAARPTVVDVSSRFGSIGWTAAGGFRGIYSYAISKAAQNMLTACLDQELRRDGIRVLAVHPGRLKTGVGAVDADTEPRVAAARLADWLEPLDREGDCVLHDLMEDGRLPW